MLGRKLWYIVTLAAFALLPLAGCSGGGSSSSNQTEKGTEIKVSGKVDVTKSSAKTLFLSATSAGAGNNVFVYDAQNGAQLGSATISGDGSFSNLTINLPTTKTILVFKAIVTQGTFRSVVPIDLSNPPAPGTISGSNPISIVISQDSTNTAAITSSMLGLTGLLGDTGMTLDAVTKTYADAAQLVVDFGGQQLAYGGAGLALSGRFSSAALLPALDANNLGAEDLNNTTLNGSISAVSIPGNNPIVSFQVTNALTGKGIRGLKTFNLVIAQLKPGANGSPEEWLSYMVTPGNPAATPPVAIGRPSTDSGYTVIDNGDGSYSVKFAKNIKDANLGVTYDANLTHRLMVGVRTTPSVALQNNGVNLNNFYNEKYFISTFVPATPGTEPTLKRDMTTTEACNECHGKIGVTTPHGGRGDVKYCMMCHTAQRGNGRTPGVDTAFISSNGEVLGDFVIMIHKIHMGTNLTNNTQYETGDRAVIMKSATGGIIYPKDVRNCRQCHKGDSPAELALAPQANNWKTKASRKSCGSCHDNVNFVTGAGHAAGAQADDASCVGCHADASLLHMTVFATPNNPDTPAGLVNFYYEVASASVDTVTNDLSIKFRIQQNTGTLSAAKTNVVFPLTGFTSSPSFLLAYYQSTANQLAITNAADWNNLGQKAGQPKTASIPAAILNGTTAPDAQGFYTMVVPSASSFPVGATLRAVGMQGSFTQTITPAIPATATSPAVPAVTSARTALSVVKAVTGDAVRREVIDSNKCGKCHEWFVGHGGSRVAGLGTVGQSICTLCHVPNLSSSGRGMQQDLLLLIINQPVGTALSSLIDFSTGSAFSGTVSQGSKATLTALVASLGSDPTLYPEASNNFKDMIHGVHAGNNSLVVGTPLRFVRDRDASTNEYNFQGVTFVGVLKDCRACHKDTLTSAGAVDASRATYTSIPAGVQASTQATTSTPATATAFIVTDPAISLQTAAGVGNNVTKVDTDRKSLPNAQDLVNSPFTATCKACHSRPNALAHFETNGGSVNKPRNQVDPNKEACVTCHGTTGPFAVWNAHRFSVIGDD